MKGKQAYIFFISLFSFLVSFAQENSKTYEQTYGLRIGADISKPIQSIFDKDYTGFELVGDYRWSYRYYLATELGKDRKATHTQYFDFVTNGQYIKLGLDYNTYDNWYGMENMIYFGGRYGFSIYSQEVTAYTNHTINNYWNENVIGSNADILRTYSGRTAHWLELVMGLKVELLKNLYASASFRFSFILYQKENDFPNFWLPGIGRVWEGSRFGVNYNYTLSYMIPFYKKKKEKKAE
ncbi:MAG: DUF6048 family protein [Capnocytophaga sp.]|nr:DUF6048 family protein [Capnocytophaga sp.]